MSSKRIVKYLFLLTLITFPLCAQAVSDNILEIDSMVRASVERTIPSKVLSRPEYLLRLIREHYLFSRENPQLLALATQQSDLHFGLKAELERNFAEEMGSLDNGVSHSELYRIGLLEAGITLTGDSNSLIIDNYITKSRVSLTNKSSAYIAGFFYANEAYAIPELTYVQDSILEYLKSRGGTQSVTLKYFFEMHLNGVEDSHRGEIGELLQQLVRTNADQVQLLTGAQDALLIFESWWKYVLRSSCSELIASERGLNETD